MNNKKYDPNVHCLQKSYFRYNNMGKFKIKGKKKTYYVNTKQKKL